MVEACEEVEVLTRDIRADVEAARTGVQQTLTKPLEQTLQSLRSAAAPSAEALNQVRATFIASAAALAAALATIFASL